MLATKDALGQDPLLAVHVGQEGLDGPRPLDESLGQVLPFVRADQPRHQVDGEAPLLALDAERHSDPLHPVLAAWVRALRSSSPVWR